MPRGVMSNRSTLFFPFNRMAAGDKTWPSGMRLAVGPPTVLLSFLKEFTYYNIKVKRTNNTRQVRENNILIDSRKKNTYSPEIKSKYTAKYLYEETVLKLGIHFVSIDKHCLCYKSQIIKY